MPHSALGLVGASLAIARKDLTIEFRSRTAFLAAQVFALLAIVVFYHAWDKTAVPAADLATGVIWVIFIYSGLMGLHRAFGLELEERAIDGLLTAPIPRESVFVGKALGNFVFIAGVQVVAIPAVFVLYNVGIGSASVAVALTAGLATIGFVAVGTLFSAMTVNTRFTELLLPMVALPFFVPIVIAAAQSTARLVSGRPVADVVAWLQVLAAYDVVFVVACVVAFPFTLED
jgi:heme exporter protein B